MSNPPVLEVTPEMVRDLAREILLAVVSRKGSVCAGDASSALVAAQKFFETTPDPARRMVEAADRARTRAAIRLDEALRRDSPEGPLVQALKAQLDDAEYDALRTRRAYGLDYEGEPS